MPWRAKSVSFACSVSPGACHDEWLSIVVFHSALFHPSRQPAWGLVLHISSEWWLIMPEWHFFVKEYYVYGGTGGWGRLCLKKKKIMLTNGAYASFWHFGILCSLNDLLWSGIEGEVVTNALTCPWLSNRYVRFWWIPKVLMKVSTMFLE